MGVKVFKKIGKCKKLLWTCELADNSLKRAIGIMTKKRFRPLLFVFDAQKEQPISIHSFLCPAFHAVFIDKDRRIVQISSVKPSQLLTSRPASYLLEVAEIKGLKVGDRLHWRL